MTLILENCRLFDGVSPDVPDGMHIRIEDARIAEVSDRPLASQSAQRMQLGGRFVMPGLIDAHFHAYGSTINIAEIDRTVPSLRALHARRLLEEALQRGFTTVRDAAGADIGLAIGTRLGLIRGPRILHCGFALSQTGGHGDMRAPDHFDGCACGFCGSMSVVVDGPDEVRKAVREQFRAGATQIKLFVSGGVLSPADPLWMNQFTEEEIGVAVYEAGTRRSYVMAHAHTADAVKRCVLNGVRSIEHATWLDDEATHLIVEHEAFAVPTLAIIDAVRELGPTLGLSSLMIDKAKEVSGYAVASLDRLRSAGAQIGLGTDLLGITTPRQSFEFRLRREVMSPLEILRSATSVNSRLLNLEGEIGVVRAGASADLIAIDGDPLDDVTILERHDRIELILKEGQTYKNTLRA